MRVLIVALAPLRPELGAPQMAMNLAAALHEQGVSASVWSPYPLPAGVSSHLTLQFARRALERYLETAGAIDVLDAPSLVLTRKVCAGRLTVARSTQPEIQYQLLGPGPFEGDAAARRALITAMHYGRAAYVIGCLLIGWARADRILCLGSLEYQWMQRWFPRWRPKTGWYVNALCERDRGQLAEIRARRLPRDPGGRKFLWIGRWARHKGVARLIEFIDAHLSRRESDLFTIAGCGDDGARQIPRCVRRGGRLSVVPRYSREQLFPMLAGHDIGLFTSIAEGLALSLYEMLESGMPVYATLAGGVPDLQPYFGSMLRQFPPRLDDPFDTGGGAERREEYQLRFSWTAIAKSYVDMVTRPLPRQDYVSAAGTGGAKQQGPT